MLIALGGMPCLPEELGYLTPRVTIEMPPVSEAPVVPESTTRPPAVARKVVPPRPDEAIRYRVMYGVLGELGEIRISYAFPGDVVRAVGMGKGSLLGFGEMERHLESQLDAKALSSRRWVTSRIQSGRTTVDTIEQPSPGSIEVVRRRTGRPDEGHRFVRKQPVLDPLGFLYWIRNRPPQTPQEYEVLDGRALWLITVEPARPGVMDKGRAALMVRGQANPIFWDGQRDSERAARSFTLWLDTDPYRTPLRLTMPLPVGEVRVDLAGIQRQVAEAPAVGTPTAGTLRPTLAKSVSE